MSQAEKWRIIGAYFCSLSGGWWPFAQESSTTNQIIHLYIWMGFVTLPIFIRLVVGYNATFGWVTCVTIAFLVFVLKFVCLKLNRLFRDAKPKFVETGVKEPTWVKLKNDLCDPEPEQEKEQPLSAVVGDDKKLGTAPPGDNEIAQKESEGNSRIMEDSENEVNSRLKIQFPEEGWGLVSASSEWEQSQFYADPIRTRWDLVSGAAGTLAEFSAQAEPLANMCALGLIRENPEREDEPGTEQKGNAEAQFQREPKLSRAGSVDYGLNYEHNRRSKARRRRDKGFSYSDPEDKNFSNSSEIEPLLPVKPESGSGIGREEKEEKLPVEGEVKIVMRRKPTRQTVPKQMIPDETLGKTQGPSASCTIRKEACTSDPERLSVSDNKLQVGELTGQLSRRTARFNHLNTLKQGSPALKSVLSESSVADVNPRNQSPNQIESPKSAENVFNPKSSEKSRNPGHGSGQLKRKRSAGNTAAEEAAELLESEMLGKLAEIDHWLVNPEQDGTSDSTNSTGKRSASPICPSSSREIFDSRFHPIGSQSTLNHQGAGDSGSGTVASLLARSNRSSSLRSGGGGGGRASIRTRSETPVNLGPITARQHSSANAVNLRHEFMAELLRITPPSIANAQNASPARLEEELNDFLNRSPRPYQIANQHAMRNLPRRLTHRTLSSDRQTGSGSNRARTHSHFEFFPIKFSSIKYQYYDVSLFSRFPFRLYYSQRELLDLIDESDSLLDIFLCSVFTGLVACLTSYLSLLSRPMAIFGYKAGSLLFEGMSLPGLFIVSATCQYSMLKSPVPDTSSPSHGYSRSMAYARAFFFLLIGQALVLLVYFSSLIDETGYQLSLYNITLVTEKTLAVAIEFTKFAILLFPIFFTLGLFSQIKTFLNWALEEFEFHMLGGSGSSGLHSVFISIVRSILCFMVPFLFAFLANTDHQNRKSFESAFSALSVCVCFMLSRQSNSNPDHDLIAVRESLGLRNAYDAVEEIAKPNKSTVRARLETSLIICMCQFVFFFLIAISGVFSEMNSLMTLELTPTHEIKFFSLLLVSLLVFSGIIVHYLIPALRNPNPWGFFKAPLLKNNEWKKFEVTEPAKVMWFETTNLFLNLVERNLILPLAILNEAWIAFESDYFADWSPLGKSFLLTLCVCKLLRHSFRSNHYQWFILLCAHLVAYDARELNFTEPVLVSWFVGNFVYIKVWGLYRRLSFLYVHILPCGSTWGSAFHAVSQPLSMPHSGWLFAQTIFTSITSAPIKPLAGASVFMASYCRPFRFWEKNYNTKFQSQETIRLQSQLETHRKKEENGNRNALFYENLASSLKLNLAGDIQMGRFGNVSEGDIFILASSSTSASQLNALIHIVEISNGIVSFQLRGLEFKGTYCQQREVEAITEDISEDEGGLCFAQCMSDCPFGRCCQRPNPMCLNFTSYLKNLVMTWKVMQKNYVLDGYSICDSSASNLFTMFDYRKQVITYFVRCIIYYTIKFDAIDDFISDQTEIIKALNQVEPYGYDSDFYFEQNAAYHGCTDIDFDIARSGVTKILFLERYLSWINFCYFKLKRDATEAPRNLVTLCFSLSLLGRKSLASAAHQVSNCEDPVRLELFLHGLHSLFQGNIMPDPSDEWIYKDTDLVLLKEVIAPALRLAIKLQHDEHKLQISTKEIENLSNSKVWEDIEVATKSTVICHENDPRWRQAVLSNQPELFSFRHVMEDETTDYRILMLIRRQLNFKIIKINSESVRGHWAAQQEELIFMRNQNPERGSIQNARAILRNIINSSCDQPIGYPNYVSPILTSYSTDHAEIQTKMGRDRTFGEILSWLVTCFGDCVATCISCNSGFGLPEDAPFSSIAMRQMHGQSHGNATQQPDQTHEPLPSNFATEPAGGKRRQSVESLSSIETINSISDQDLGQLAEIVDDNLVLSNLDGFRRGGPQLVHWNDAKWRNNGGARSWGLWRPDRGDQGVVVWGWYPCHRNHTKRAHIHTPILLLCVKDGDNVDRFVPVQKPGVKFVEIPSSPCPATPVPGQIEPLAGLEYKTE